MAAELDIAELGIDRAGQQLRRAREAVGKTIADISAATKIPERLLLAIEESQFSALPSRIYAIGFSRSYARVVGLDEAAIVSEVRTELDGAAPRTDVTATQAFAPGDPARVPDLRLALVAGVAALAVIVGGLAFWHGGWNTQGSLPSILPADVRPAAGKPQAAVQNARPASAAAAAPALPVGGTVALTAQADGVWIKVYEASGKTLFEKQMTLGQSFTLPADAQAPLIWTARPDALAITIGGRAVPKLSETQKIMKGVPISAAALLARAAPPAVAPDAVASTATR